MSLLAAPVAGCHNLSDEPADSGVVPADMPLALRVAAIGVDGYDIAQSLRVRLVESGFDLDDQAPLVKVDIEVTMTKDEDTVVPLVGTVSGSYRFFVSVVVSDATSGEARRRFTLERSHRDPRFTMKDAGHVVARLRQQRLDEVAATLREEARARQARAREVEQAAWAEVDLDACRHAPRPADCDGVEAFITRFGGGPHVAEALAVRLEGTQSIAAAEVERAWQALPLDACREPLRSDDCAAVDAFVVRNPHAPQSDVARALLAETRARREELAEREKALAAEQAAKEAAQAEAQARLDAAQAKRDELAAEREARAECLRECRRSYEAYRDFDTLVARCYQTECLWEE